ncbi:MAG: hypothetical protein FJ125_14965, partial [Deltaproteobacteria bacterium]|nr:hypothetical protein [Deltaproteobacteria bacterium]
MHSQFSCQDRSMPRPIATRSCPPPLGSPLAGRPLVPLLGLALLLLTASCGEETAAVKKTADDGRVDTRGKELVLSSVRPAVVPATGNVAVVGMGAGFLEGLTVSVAGQTVSDVELLDRYGTMLLFTVPAGVEGQKVDVVVTNPSGAMAKLTAAITYGPPLPPRDPQQDPLELSSLQPDNAPADGGALLVAGGAGFGGTLSVSLGGVQAEDVRVLDSAGTLLSFPAPPGREGQSVDLVVQRNGRESATLTGALTYGARQARIAPADEPLLLRSLEPAEVPADGGTLVVARGSGFVLEMTLTVGGIAVASPTVLDETGTVLTF